MSDPFLSEIRMMSFPFAPKGWAFCNGQILPIQQNQALFSLLGITYGGNGITTFGLPNFQGRLPIHVGSGYALGQSSGEIVHALSVNEMPTHTHMVLASDIAASTPLLSGNYLASMNNAYAPTPVTPTTLQPSTVTSVGGGQPHNNMMPYLTINFCIALQGIYPSRD